LGDEGLARAENFPTAAKLVAAVTGVPVREARARIELGRRLRGTALLGDTLGPEPFPDVSAALAAGVLGVDAAAAITRELDHLRTRGIDPTRIGAAETTLVGLGGQTVGGYCFTADEIARAAVRLRETLDPDGLEPRAERMQELRGMTMSRCRDGMHRGRFTLTPEQAGIWLTASQALTSPHVAPRFAPADGRTDTSADTTAHLAAGTGADTRSSDQANAGTTNSHPHADPATPQPEHPGTGASQCSADGSDYAHHVHPWHTDTHLPGTTDTDNGMLLRHFHHTHLHRSDWKLTMIHGAPHIIPPRWIDTTQTPRPCTQRRTTPPPRHHQITRDHRLNPPPGHRVDAPPTPSVNAPRPTDQPTTRPVRQRTSRPPRQSATRLQCPQLR
jgi:hypothetical protein